MTPLPGVLSALPVGPPRKLQIGAGTHLAPGYKVGSNNATAITVSLSSGLPVWWPFFGCAVRGFLCKSRRITSFNAACPIVSLWRPEKVVQSPAPTSADCSEQLAVSVPPPCERFPNMPGEEDLQRKRGHCLLPDLPSVPRVTGLALLPLYTAYTSLYLIVSLNKTLGFFLTWNPKFQIYA